ncbi:hypothetical protein CQW23_23844 [Capsicum baccatum]|uniref:Ubiquitin-like protease family profile domain-containing protein n=1 Tax=Capsicum baccatum TaxID=33114 RepID=A0A2G2VT39_CAPBA|nr:hypothetical protein CQW23_23844 [Capsicum baccatum]
MSTSYTLTAWAFEAIPYLRQQVNYQKEVFCLRILRWLMAKIDKNEKFLGLFNPPKEAVDVTTEATAEKNNIIVDNLSTTSKEEEKVKPHIDVIFYYLRKKAKLQTLEQYRYTTDNSLYKVYINNAYDRYCQQQPKVSRNEECLINIIKGFSIPTVLPWPLVDELYIPINCGDEFHWVLAVITLKDRDCSPFVAAYAEHLSDGLQVPNDELHARLLRKRYIALLWKYGEAKAQKSYTSDIKDP